MRDALLVGFRSRLLPVPPALWRREVARKAERIAGSLGWMMPDHHRVRDRCVLELSRGARPVSPAALADGLQLAVERVVTILDGLERHLTFLFRGALGEVTWAYPFTAEPTPHRLTLDSGERLYAAGGVDAIAAPFVKGRLEERTVAAEVTTSCAHCGEPLRIETDGSGCASATPGAAPLVFAPLVDFRRWRAKSIIDGFGRQSVFLWSEAHARDHRRQTRLPRGTYMTLAQALHATPLVQGALFALVARSRTSAPGWGYNGNRAGEGAGGGGVRSRWTSWPRQSAGLVG